MEEHFLIHNDWSEFASRNDSNVAAAMRNRAWPPSTSPIARLLCLQLAATVAKAAAVENIFMRKSLAQPALRRNESTGEIGFFFQI